MRKIFTILLLLCSVSLSANTKTRKAVFIIADGIPADQVERLTPPAIFDIAQKGSYARAQMGGEIGSYSQTPTVSAICYTSMLTSAWINKHDVSGNDNQNPNYNYPTIFRIAKDQQKDFKTAIYSSWTDNRTVLLGEGKQETNHLKIDFAKDGYDLDTVHFGKKEKNLHIFEIDETVSLKAAEGIRKAAPDLSWVYLWYTDDAGHMAGNGAYFDEYVMKADMQIQRIWEAVQYREANFDEEWMIVVFTDHGRTENGYSHGGQSDRERTIWFATNQPVNDYASTNDLAITDIAPSISKFMGFEIPHNTLWEQDGKSFYGKADIYNFKVRPYDNQAHLSWETFDKKAPVTIYISTTNNYKDGRSDEWIEIDTVEADKQNYQINLDDYPESKFYKFVLATSNNHLNKWMIK